jgi:hypothetical protein
MKSKRIVSVSKERVVKTYAEMWHTSYCLFQKGIEDQKGCCHQFMASLVFTAFTLEAYLNHIGPKVFNCWDDLERLSPREKLNVIVEKLQVDIHYGHRPWQVVKHLFGFRNNIAHGKSVVVKSNSVVPLDRYSDDRLGDYARTVWEKYCTRENAKKAREDVEKIVHLLYEAGSFVDDYPFVKGVQLHRAALVDE